MKVTLSYADLDSLPAYVEDDLRLIREVADDLNGADAAIEKKNAAEFAARRPREEM